MAETIFSFDEHNYQQCQSAFRGEGSGEYYLGEYSIDGGCEVDVRAEKKAVGACSIIRLRSKTRLLFRRSLAHIREDATDVTVLWFVKRGRIRVTHQTGCTVANGGDFIVTKSMTPFVMECQTDAENRHEALHLVVPTHALSRFVPQDTRTGFCVADAGREFTIAEHILTDVFEDNGELAEHVTRLLVESALRVLGAAIANRSIASGRKSVVEKRLQDVFRYVEIHLADPKLNMTTVATACGISHRYLCGLLNAHGTLFSTLVWGKRLSMASRWLLQSTQAEASVAEIAYRVGFKSPSHFSRMFKRRYRLSPSEYRTSGVAEADLSDHDLFEPPAKEATSLHGSQSARASVEINAARMQSQ